MTRVINDSDPEAVENKSYRGRTGEEDGGKGRKGWQRGVKGIGLEVTKETIKQRVSEKEGNTDQTVMETEMQV